MEMGTIGKICKTCKHNVLDPEIIVDPPHKASHTHTRGGGLKGRIC